MSTISTTGLTRISREEARKLASAEFEKFAALTASLSPEERMTDTDCVGWNVRTMVFTSSAPLTPRLPRWSSCTNCAAVCR